MILLDTNMPAPNSIVAALESLVAVVLTMIERIDHLDRSIINLTHAISEMDSDYMDDEEDDDTDNYVENN